MKIFSPALSPEEQAERNRYIKIQQQKYEFTHEYPDLEGLSLLKEIPPEENFSAAYLAQRLANAADILANMLAVTARSFFDPLDKLEEYEDFFTVLRKPDIIKNHQTDRTFAEQRLSGANPLVIEHFTEIPVGINISLQDLNESTQSLFSLQATDLQSEIEQGSIYIANYTESLSFVRGGNYENKRKYLPKPIAFFWWQKNGSSNQGELVPIAIVIALASSAKKWEIFTPRNAELDWFFAKTCVQIADANHHEMNSHLGRTHLLIEPFAVSTARQLAENHPLGLLLRQHFRFMLTNNFLARARLINEGGFVDRVLAGTLSESLQIATNACTSWSIKDFAFPTEIKNRGMDVKDNQGNQKLPHYPYRDDGLLVWQAIKDFVASYLQVFYPEVENIQNDLELQKWAEELASADGGKVPDMPEKISNIGELIEIVTTIIFICGPQHSAVNFSQYEYIAFALNMPFAAYEKITGAKKQVKTEQDLLKFLPPQKQTGDQLEMMYILSDYRYDRLGYYDEKFENIVKGTDIEAILAKFKQDLGKVEEEIDKNNDKRIVAYPFLKPSLVLNSISI